MVVYINTQAMDVGVVVGVEVGFGSKDTRDGDEGDDEDWVRYSCCPPLEIVFTSCKGAEGGSGYWDVYETA